MMEDIYNSFDEGKSDNSFTRPPEEEMEGGSVCKKQKTTAQDPMLDTTLREEVRFVRCFLLCYGILI